MRIYKMIYLDKYELDKNGVFDLLEEQEVLIRADYGTIEIHSNNLKSFVETFEDKEKIEEVEETLGLDVVHLLVSGEIDFAVVIE